MSRSEVTFRVRRRRSMLSVIFGLVVLAPVAIGYQLAFSDIVMTSGWFLLSLVLFLAFYNVRKKLTYPPLLNSATWLQLHIYLGVAAGVVFLFHTAGQLPTGALDTTVYCLFVFMLFSGVVGLYLTRTVPPTLATRGNEVIFERIPLFRRQIKDRVEEIVLESIERSDAGILASYYESYLMYFLSGPRNILGHIVRSDRTNRNLMHELQEAKRYLDPDDQKRAEELHTLIDLKDDLDFHYARQGMLKVWLFFHIPVTVVLMIFLVVHVVLMYAFAGGVS